MTKTAPTDITYDDAVEAINVAIALGHPAPCFPGSTYYQARVWVWNEEYQQAEDDYDLGVYVSEEAAHIAVRNHAVYMWDNAGEHPLLPNLKEDEEPDYTGIPDIRIINAYYRANTNPYSNTNVYSVDKVEIVSTPVRA